MNEGFEKFNSCFPNSKYRIIKAHVECADDSEASLQQYQQAKAPVDRNLYTYEQLSSEPLKSNILKNKYRIAWEVSEGYVVADLDNKTEARVAFDIIQSRKVKTAFTVTKHGGHFIFKNNADVPQSAGKKCSLGLRVDTRVANKGYIILPVNDPDRKWGDITNDIDGIPKYLIPLKNVRIETDFLGMSTGDGRNDALLKHMLNLLDYDTLLTKEEKVDSIRLINRFLFKQALTDEELNNTVLRPEIVNKTKDKDIDTCLEEKIATSILEKHNIISTSDDNFYMYNGKYYARIKDPRELERMIHFEYGKALKEKQRVEIIKFLRLKSYISTDKLNTNWNEIVLKNGILNITTKELKPHTPTQYNTIYVDCNYVNDAPFSKAIDDFFNTLAPAELEKKMLLYEMIGYCLLRKNIFTKFFVCVGEGSTGKSTYLNMISRLLGRDNASFLNLENMEDKYMPAELFGKLVNLGDDIGYKPIKETANLKKIVSGEMFAVEQKYKTPLSFSNFATLIFTSNRLPMVDDRTTGFYRRFVIVDINRVITNPDPLFLDKLTSYDYEYLLYKAVEYISEAIKRGCLSIPRTSQLALENFRVEQSSVLAFLHELQIAREQVHLRPCTEMYAAYEHFCTEFGYKPLRKSRFEAELCVEYKLNKKNTTKGGVNQCWRYVYSEI